MTGEKGEEGPDMAGGQWFILYSRYIHMYNIYFHTGEDTNKLTCGFEVKLFLSIRPDK